MKSSEIINILMFDYDTLSDEQLTELACRLPKKLIRWVGVNHPDNRTRKIFYLLTNVAIGEGTVININFIVSDDYLPLLYIGNNVAISPNVTVICSSNPNNSHIDDNDYVRNNLIKTDRVVISDDVWIGVGAILLPGITIGAASIIAAGAIVNTDVPSNTLVAGVPARILRRIS